MRKLTLIFTALTLMIGVFGVQAQDAPAVPVKIAFLGPITGAAASIGQEQLQWMRLAVDDFNARTGWSVEIVEGDTELDAAAGVAAAETVAADPDVYGVVGPASSQVVEAAGAILDDNGLVYVSGSATRPSLTDGALANFFRTVPNDSVQGPTDATFAIEEIGAMNAFLIDDQSSYAAGLADEFEATFTELGGTVIERAQVTQDDIDFSSLVTRIGGSGADIIFFPGQLASQGALLATQMAEQGIDITLFGADGFFFVDDFIIPAAGTNEGNYVSSFAPDIRGIPTSEEIVARYVEQYDDNFGTFGPPTYAGAQAVLEAMERAHANGDLSRAGVLAEMELTNIELSLLGTPLAFDENGDVLDAQFFIFQVIGDEFVTVASSGDEEMMEEDMEGGEMEEDMAEEPMETPES